MVNAFLTVGSPGDANHLKIAPAATSNDEEKPTVKKALTAASTSNTVDTIATTKPVVCATCYGRGWFLKKMGRG